MSKIDAFALRGVVVAAITSRPEPFERPDPGRGRSEPPSLDRVYPWHFIR
jgi:hypothetical protein